MRKRPDGGRAKLTAVFSKGTHRIHPNPRPFHTMSWTAPDTKQRGLSFPLGPQSALGEEGRVSLVGRVLPDPLRPWVARCGGHGRGYREKCHLGEGYNQGTRAPAPGRVGWCGCSVQLVGSPPWGDFRRGESTKESIWRPPLLPPPCRRGPARCRRMGSPQEQRRRRVAPTATRKAATSRGRRRRGRRRRGRRRRGRRRRGRRRRGSR